MTGTTNTVDNSANPTHDNESLYLRLEMPSLGGFTSSYSSGTAAIPVG